jgi:hypothetical protein
MPLVGRFGVSERVRGTLERIGVLHTLGAANVVATDPHLLAAIEQGRERAPHQMSQQRARPGTGMAPQHHPARSAPTDTRPEGESPHG